MRRPLNLGVIEDRDNLGPWLERLRGGPLAIDTETTGVNWMTDRVGGLCLAARESAVYVCRDALGPAVRWLADEVKRERTLYFHNAKFDLHHLRGTFGLHIRYPVDDSMLASFLLDNRGAPTPSGWFAGNGLKELATAYVDPEAHEAEERLREAVIAAGGRRGKKGDNSYKADVLMAPPRIVGEYGALDAWYTLELGRQFVQRIDHWVQPDDFPPLRSLYDTERWLCLALVDMEARGIRVDPAFFEDWKEKLVVQKAEIKEELIRLAGRDINWNSAPQLRELLYTELEIPVDRWTEGGKKPKKDGTTSPPSPSTDEVALTKLKHPIGAVLLRYREVDKQLGTYAEGLLDAIWPDGKIHCNFKADGARTGRLSCSKPNLQQVPRESGARSGFVPEDGLVLRFADYSQVEMRFAAHMSNDPVLVGGFRDDPNFDTHAATAMKMWGLREQPSKQQRKFAKIMNFAMLYGAGVDKITSQLVSMLTRKEARASVREFGHTLAAGEQPHRALAELLRERYFAEFATIKKAKYVAESDFERRGYTINEFGRLRFMEPREKYKALNSVIQGSAADLAKRGIVNLYRELQRKDGSIALLLQIHDEAVYLSEGDPAVDKRVLELLADHDGFGVPMIADVSGSSKNWQDKLSIDFSEEAA